LMALLMTVTKSEWNQAMQAKTEQYGMYKDTECVCVCVCVCAFVFLCLCRCLDCYSCPP
jgi:hypothetical protein